MKNFYSFIFLIFTCIACDNEDVQSTDLTGVWKLTEVLADPGDGSGTFQPVESNNTISLFQDGTFTASRNLCYFGTQDGASTGIYDTIRSVLTIEGCEINEVEVDYPYEFNVGEGSLIINLFCIEPCAEKYRKISSK